MLVRGTEGRRSIWAGTSTPRTAIVLLSGAISKTVNPSAEATVEDLAVIQLEAWRLGVKCFAVYRDGCKAHEPLSAKAGEPAGAKSEERRAKSEERRAKSEERRAKSEERRAKSEESVSAEAEGRPPPTRERLQWHWRARTFSLSHFASRSLKATAPSASTTTAGPGS